MSNILKFRNNPWTTDYHSHTSDWSDGENTVEEMISKAESIGLERLMITDHCTIEEKNMYSLGRNGARRDPSARNINDNGTNLILGFGVEADILDEEGNIRSDIQERYFDFIILSLHGSAYTGDPRKVTEGFINAMKKYPIRIIGHPYDFHLDPMNVGQIVKCANKFGIGVEFNCKSVLSGNANMDGVMTVLDKSEKLYFTTDAHSVDALEEDRRRGLQFLKDEGFERDISRGKE